MNSETCHDCGGRLVLSSGPGRTRKYRGEPGYVIPSDLSFPCCQSCGAEWLTAGQVMLMSAAFEQQRAERAA